MKNCIIISSILMALLSLSGCEYITTINKTGETDSLFFQCQSPTELEITAPCRIQFINGSSDKIVLKGYDFIIEDYSISQTENKLKISHKNSNFIQKEKMGTVYICLNSISNITLNAPAILASSDTIQMQSLSIVINGSGIYSETDLKVDCQNLNLTVYGGVNQTMHYLSGNASNTNFYIEGCTLVNASELKSHTTTVIHRSIADCNINADNELGVTIFSTGNVYYKGNPTMIFFRHKTSLMSATGNAFHLTE